MKIIFKLMEQHKMIMKLLDKIYDCIQRGQAEVDPRIVLPLLDILNLQLEKHFKLEDDVLYPFLKDHTNFDIQTTGELFWVQLGKLKEHFNAYIKEWTEEKAIEDYKEEFINRTERIVEDLRIRITHEDSDLFPLLRDQ
jgi:hemerythrin-like domain-containing protein